MSGESVLSGHVAHRYVTGIDHAGQLLLRSALWEAQSTWMCTMLTLRLSRPRDMVVAWLEHCK